MARNIQSRYRITGILTALTPLHVGGYGDSAETDLPLARNGAGEFYMPGTSLAGVLRAWYERAFGKASTQELWGFQQHETGHASYVLIDDAPVQLPEGAYVEIRDGVGIDRVWGTAAEGIKYDRAVLPRGTRIPWVMTLEIPARQLSKALQQSETPDAFDARVRHTKALLGHLLVALEAGNIAFGAARTRGLGRMACTLHTVLHQQFDSREGILAVLQGQGTAVTPQDLIAADAATLPERQPCLKMAIRWEPCGSLMVKAGYDGVGVDILPLVSATEQGVALVLPGSAIKGVLRSQAERIVRTVLGRRAASLTNARQRFLTHLEELPLIRELFGSRTQSPEALSAAPVPATGPLPGLGALAVDDCYARDSMPLEHWRAVTIARTAPEQSYEDQELWKTLKILEHVPQGRGHYTVAHHVAIDRWTGGAADGMLFSVLEPVHITWHDLRLTLDLGRLPETLRLPGLMLLLLTLRDLLHNRLPLGFATNRGMGELVVSEIHFQGTALDAIALGTFTDFRLSEAGFGTLDAIMRERLTTEWQAWIATQAAGALQ